MRLVWSANSEFARQRCWRTCELTPEELRAREESRKRRRARAKCGNGSNWWKHLHPLIGPRQRLPQAKDVPEAAILEVLNTMPGVQFTHFNLDADNSIPRLSPELAAFPEKVLHAKLSSMSRRGLIEGGGHFLSRCDWHVPARTKEDEDRIHGRFRKAMANVNKLAKELAPTPGSNAAAVAEALLGAILYGQTSVEGPVDPETGAITLRPLAKRVIR